MEGSYSLIIIGADKGGVGKTTVARLLTEYYEIQNKRVTVFDTEYPNGGFARYHPDRCKIIDLFDTKHQCALWEEIREPGSVSIVDLRAGELSRTLNFLMEVGAFDEVKEKSLNLSVLHLMGASISSLEEFAEVESYRRLCNYFIVKNFISHAEFFSRNGELAKKFVLDIDPEREIVIPRLDALAFEYVDLAGLPFYEFALDDKQSDNGQRKSFVLRGYVKSWLERTWDIFERAGMDSLAVG